MAISVKVKKGDLRKALNRMQDAIYRTKLMERYREHEHYEKPCEKRRKKHSRAVFRERCRTRELMEYLNR